MGLADMPARGERSAPYFDDSRPEELNRYFADLQFLLNRFQVVNENERKQAAVKYLKICTEQLWTTTRTWANQTAIFDEFKTEVFQLYPGTSADQTWSIQDLDLLIGQTSRVGILTTTDLGEYYRQFLLISRYLISMNRLSTHEQSRSFFCGLQPSLEGRVRQRQQLKFLNHLPDDPYDIAAVYEAVSYVLMGSAAMGVVQVPPPPAQILPAPPVTATTSTSPGDPAMVKIEAMIAAAMASFGDKIGDKIKDAITQQAGARPRNAGSAATGVSRSGNRGACNFCGSTDHFIRDCDVVVEHTKAGKCKHSSASGKVVLPSGAEVPRGIPGTWLRDRIDEWHRQNPGQMGAAQMFFEVMAKATAPLETAATQSFPNHPVWHVGREPGVVSAEAYTLNRQQRPRPEVVIDSQPPRNRSRAVADVLVRARMPAAVAVRWLPKRGKMKGPHQIKAPSPQTATKTEGDPQSPHTRTPPLLMPLTDLFQVQSDPQRETQRLTAMSLPSGPPRRSTTSGWRRRSSTAPWQLQSPSHRGSCYCWLLKCALKSQMRLSRGACPENLWCRR